MAKDYKIIVESVGGTRTASGGRGTIQIPESEFPIKWTYTHTKRYPARVEVCEEDGQQIETGRYFPVAMLITNPPRLKKCLGRVRYVEVFNAISDACWFVNRGLIDPDAGDSVVLSTELAKEIVLLTAEQRAEEVRKYHAERVTAGTAPVDEDIPF